MLPALLLHISLVFPHTTLLSPAARVSAIAEAAAIWSARGVRVDGDEPRAPTVLTVVATAASPAPRGVRPPLAAITFAPDGTPAPRVVLYLSEIRRLLEGVRFLGLEESRWPPDLRETIVGRAVGRVLAHEIGHYLLRSRGHTETGLMRSFQRAEDLVGLPRAPFTPAPIEDGVVTVNGETVGESGKREAARVGAGVRGATAGASVRRPRPWTRQ